ncbi:MAG: L,D-transpeptidase, partial [Verrucomicrobiota bacterium]
MRSHEHSSIPQNIPPVPSRAGRALAGTLVVLLLFAPIPSTEAGGFFKELRAKRQARIAERNREAKPRPVYRSHYRDAHGDAYINQTLLEQDKEAERKVVIDIRRQRAFLVVDDLIAVDSAVSTARRGKYTPRGTFTITEKIKSGKVSTIYNVYMPNWM